MSGDGREGGPVRNPGGMPAVQRWDGPKRERKTWDEDAVFQRPTSDSHVMTCCHVPVISQRESEILTYGRFDTFFLIFDFVM